MKTSIIARSTWAVSAAFGCIAVWYTGHHYERRIAAAQSSTVVLYSMTSANERTVRDAVRLRAAQAAARRDLDRAGAGVSLPAATALLLERLERQARAHGTTVAGITPAAAQGILQMRGLPATPITMHMRGTFRAVVSFLSDASRRTPLLEIRRAQLAPAGTSNSHGEPLLDTSIDAVMYRLAQPAVEKRNAAAR